AIFVSEINELIATAGVSPTAIELTEAAAKRASPAVASALTALQESLVASKDPLAKWNASLRGGDPVSGAALFASHPASQCMRCHRAEDGHSAGGEAAPNLAGIANRHQDHRYFLESMVLPSNLITPGYGSVLVDFKNGASLGGNLIAESQDHLDLDASGKLLRVNRSDIASFTPPVSSMPPMGTVLSATELRDIVAWLASLTEGGVPVKSTAEPVPLDPATLEIPEKPATPAVDGSIDPAFMKTGKQQFLVCGACHGQSGEGTAAGPPLAGSEWVTGPEENLIRIQLRGLQGPIKVKGVEYNFPAGMAAMAYQSDEQIAAVLTYVRNSFGNTAPPVTAAAVAALRGEVGKPQLSAAELIPPTPAPAATGAAAPAIPAGPAPGKYDRLTTPSSRPKWITVALLIGVLALLAKAFFKK
ncbi:MAG: c-type cytochrome, partial [Luteolibacter sp.]